MSVVVDGCCRYSLLVIESKPLAGLDAWVVARASTEAVQFVAVRYLSQLRARSAGRLWVPVFVARANPERFAEWLGVKRLPVVLPHLVAASRLAGFPGLAAAGRLPAEMSAEAVAVLATWLDASAVASASGVATVAEVS